MNPHQPNHSRSILLKNKGVLVPVATSRSVLWTVDQFWFRLQTERFICSDTFKVPSLPNSLFYLWLCLEDNSTLTLTAYRNDRIRLSNPPSKNDSLKIDLTVKDANSIIWKSEKLSMQEDATPSIKIEKSTLEESLRVSSRECLEIHCTVINKEILPSQAQRKARSENFMENYVPSISCSELKEHLEVMLDGDAENSVSISVGGEVFQVHKKLLCANSSVFSAMFQHDTQEKAQNHIDIEDMSAEALGEILSFVYFGKTRKITHELCVEVYVAADKYAIMPLKKQCSNYLISNITRDKVLDVLLLAYHHSDNELTTGSVEFLVKKVPQVIESDFFVQFVETEPEIGRNIIMYLLKNK